MRISKSELLLYIFVFLYPILPTYFTVGGNPFTLLMAIIYIGLNLFLGIKRRYIIKKEIKQLIIACGLMLVPIAIHQEGLSFLNILVEQLAVIMMVYSIKKKGTIDKCINLLILAGIIIAICGIVEFTFDFNVFSLIENTDTVGNMGTAYQTRFSYRRAEGSFSQSIPYAIYLSFIFVLLFYKTFLVKIKKRKRNINIVLLIVISAGLLLSFSRVPIVLFFVMLIALLYVKGWQKGFKITVGIFAVFIFLTIFTSIVGIKIPVLSQIIDMLVAMFSDSKTQEIAGTFGNDNLYAWSYRLMIMTTIPRLLSGKWLLGGGMSFANQGFWISSVHAVSLDNNYLTLLVRYGVVGLVGRLLYIITGIQAAAKLSKSKGEYSMFGKVSRIILVTYLLEWINVAELRETRFVSVLIAIIVATAIRERSTVYNGNKGYIQSSPISEKVESRA